MAGLVSLDDRFLVCSKMRGIGNSGGYTSVITHRISKYGYAHFFIYHMYNATTDSSYINEAIVECFASFSNLRTPLLRYRITGRSHDIDNNKFAIGYIVDGDVMNIISPNYAYNNYCCDISNRNTKLDSSIITNTSGATTYLSGSNF